MGSLPAISVDSMGGRSVSGLPPLRDDPGNRADRENAVRVFEVLRRDPPGQTTDDSWQQAKSFTAGVYIAVNTIMTAMAGATVQVLQRKTGVVTKSQATSAAGSQESEWSPVDPDHEICRLFVDPNPKDTSSDFLSEYVLCRSLFGLGAIMWTRGRDGKPAELWNLRRNYLTAVQGLTTDYPRGAWRYTMPQPMLWTSAAGQLVLANEQVVQHRRPHPLFPWDAYSPLTGGGKLVDFLNAVIDSRQMAMDRGLTLDAVVNMPGATPDQVQLLDAKIREKFTGSNRGQRWAVLNSDDINVAQLGNTPDKMAYADSYQHGVAAVLALFGVPAVCAFLADADYSGFYAAARAWREGNLGGEANSIGQRWTKDLVIPHWGAGFKLEVKLPPLMDPEQRERQVGTLLSAKAITRNEARAAYDMVPLEDGDQTPDEFAAEVQKKNQPDPTGGMGGGDPLAALLGGDPNAEPSAPGDVENPEVGEASAGSLPGAVAKSLGAYFDRLVREVCA